MSERLETGDMQGLLLTAYGHLPCAAYLLVRVAEPRAARGWLRALRPHVTDALADPERAKRERASLNVAFTATGLARLGLPADAVASFPPAFQDGMATPRRSRVLGDAGPNAPDAWRWGGPGTRVDGVLMVYAVDARELAERVERWRPPAGAGVEVVQMLGAEQQPDAREHFGFVDGVGQPVIAASGRADRQRARTGHATELPAGEFVLGYANAYGIAPPLPTVAARDDAAGALPPAAGQPGRCAFGRNGSYVVFRQLRQDVAGFWRFMHAAAERVWPGDPDGAVRLAAKCVGRWPSGAPLVRHPERDPYHGVPQDRPDNTFAYAAQDPHGDACPLGAHVRRANPRDALGPDPRTARAAANRHRLLRRGRSYGERLPEDRRTEDDGAERGLHFICRNADLERQFEFVQQTWVNNPVFAGLGGETDPVVGDQARCGRTFTVQGRPLRRRVHDLQRFVTVRGGAYFFLPGLRALEYLAAERGAAALNPDLRIRD